MAFVFPIEEWLGKVSDEAPCGVFEPNHAGQIDALLGRVRTRPAETTLRDGEKVEIRAAEEPDWSLLLSVAEALFRGSGTRDLSAGQQGGQLQCKPIKHLAPALVLTLAALQTKGLPGFADGLELVSRLLGDYWTSLHPLPVDDPEEPFYPRANILVPLGRPFNELNDSWRFVERLYAATLIESPLNNALSVRDCLAPYAAELQLKLPDGRPTTEAMIASALSEAAGLPRQQEVLDQAIKAARNIEAAFRDKAADKGTPPLEGLVGVLEAAARVLKSKSPAEGGTTPGGGAGAQGAGQGNPLIPAGPITSRADAARRLSEVAEYFRQNESSSPVPFLLERVLRVIGSKDFLGLLGELDELGAEALPGFKKLAGIKDPATPPET